MARADDPDAADTVGMDWSKVPEYRMVPGDLLAIDLGPKPDPSMEYLHEVTIRPDGRITVYPIGDVVAAGLTPMELQKSLIAMLSADLRAAPRHGGSRRRAPRTRCTCWAVSSARARCRRCRS